MVNFNHGYLMLRMTIHNAYRSPLVDEFHVYHTNTDVANSIEPS